MRRRSCARVDSRMKTSPSDERAEFRRAIAQRCLYGVDINPMAVQLGRLSLWLATLSAGSTPDIPGPPPADRQQPRRCVTGGYRTTGTGRRRARTTCRASALWRRLLRRGPRRRDRRQVAHRDGTWRHARAGASEGARAHGAEPRRRAGRAMEGGVRPVVRRVVRRARPAPRIGAVRRDRGRDSGARHVCRDTWRRRSSPSRGASRPGNASFTGRSSSRRSSATLVGEPLPAPGFDAIVGNPPWEMLRGDRGDADTRDTARTAAAKLTHFARGSGVYTAQGDGHVNLYQLFLERSLALLRHGGRLGMVLPSGLATDRGAAPLRRALFDRTHVDTLVSLENRERMFPVHRSLKFLLVSATVRRAHVGDPVPLRHSTARTPWTSCRSSARTATPSCSRGRCSST